MRVALSLVLALLVLFAGCGDDDGAVPTTGEATTTSAAATTTSAAPTTTTVPPTSTTEAPDRQFSGSLEATETLSGPISFVVSGSGQIMGLAIEPVLGSFQCGMEHPSYTTWQVTFDFSNMPRPIMVEGGQFAFDGGDFAWEGVFDSADMAHGTIQFEVPGCSPMYAASAAWTATGSPSGSEASATTTATTSAAGMTVTELTIGVEISGSGNRVLALPLPGRETVIASFSYNGSGEFSVQSPSFIGVMCFGAYQGTRLIHALGDTDLVMLQISADGDWSALVEPLAAAPRIPESGEYEGIGDAVLIDTFAPANDFQATFTYEGEGNFAVNGWGADGALTQTGAPISLPVNVIGTYQGTVTVLGNTVIYDISACSLGCDPWTITLHR